MATLTINDVERQIESYRIKLQTLKIGKLKKFDARKNNKVSREEFIEHIDSIIEARVADAEDKAQKLICAHNDATKYDPYRVLNLSGDDKFNHKQEYLSNTSKDRELSLNKKNVNNNNNSNNSSSDTIKTPGTNIDWSQVFENPNNPLIIDAGCGHGKFLLRFAWEGQNGKQQTIAKDKNYLGIEIRQGLVDIATNYRNKLGYQNNVSYIHAEFNTNFVLENLAKYPGRIEILCCQMPDPRFKKNMKRHGKKKLTVTRIIQPSLVSALATVLDPVNGVIYISSEYEEVHIDMKTCILNNGNFRLANMDEINNLYFSKYSSTYSACSEPNITPEKLISNPFGCETERELYLRENKKGNHIWRMVFHTERKNIDNNDGIINKKSIDGED